MSWHAHKTCIILMKSQWKGSNLENGGWCYHAGDPTRFLWSVEWQNHGATGWRVTAQRTAGGSCAFSPATWFAQKSPPLVALPSVHVCVCMIGYTRRLIQVWSVAFSQCRRRNSSNRMYDKSMLGCIIRCRGYQMRASLKHNPWFFRLVFYSIDHSSVKVSNLSFTGFPRMSDSCFVVVNHSDVLTSTYSESEAKLSFSHHFKQRKYLECF